MSKQLPPVLDSACCTPLVAEPIRLRLLSLIGAAPGSTTGWWRPRSNS
ncbi:hypothetical protein [Nonomuraea typhae]|uniref:Transcriptional regulator n=1 Tax=Nonomuraea typhae TaxID=2603600 RepID=A0ABW7Z9Y6_9ACTN